MTWPGSELHTHRKMKTENNYTKQKQKPSLILGLNGRLFLVQTTFVCQDLSKKGSENLVKARRVVSSNRKTSNVAAQSTFSSCDVTCGGGDWCLLPSKSAVMSSLDVHVNNSWKVNVFDKRSSFRKMLVQSGTFPNPSMGSKSSGCAQMNSLWRDGAGGKTQMREMRIGMVGDSVLCWGEWWEIKCSTIVCLDMCFIRYVSWKK